MEREIDFGQFERAERVATSLPWAVYRAIDGETGGSVRLCVLWAGESPTPERRRASLDWFAEAGYQSQRLAHPALASVVSYRSIADAAWVATSGPPGSPLSELLAGGGPMTVDQAMRASSVIASALADAHAAGWAHGFLNAETAWLDADLVTVTDLGLGLAAREMHPRILPYETTPGLLSSDPRRRDIQCLGLLITEMLTGPLPTPVGLPRPEVFPESVPPRAVKRIRALINPQAEDAMSAAEWAEYARTGEPEEVVPEEPAAAVPDAQFYDAPARRQLPWAWIATAVGFLVLAAAIVVLWFRQTPGMPTAAPRGSSGAPAGPAIAPRVKAEPAAPAAPPPPDVLTRVQVGPVQPADEDKTIGKLEAMHYKPFRKLDSGEVYFQVDALANADNAATEAEELRRAGFHVRLK